MELGRLTRRDDSVEVHLVGEENYFVFQPLLPEVISCSIEPSHILNPIRQLCKHVIFHCAAVQSIDVDKHTVTLAGDDARQVRTLPFDHLIVCTGLRMDLSRIPGMAEHSLPIKTLGDAFHLRNHVLSRLEEADLETDSATQRRLLTFVAVGGGFSGVETIAELNDMIRSVLRYYPNADAIGPRLILVHSRSCILNELDPRLAEFAQRKLRKRGVELVLNCRVSEATDEEVVLSNGQSIPAGTVISTVGNAPHPLIADSGLPQQKGRLLVDECLRVGDAGNLWALGDAALVPAHSGDGFCPPTAQFAHRQGKLCARNVLATLKHRPLQPFRFSGLGQLAVIGRRCGVAQIFGVRIAGLLAWCMWRSVYFSKLPGLRCKVRVGIDWALDMLFPRDITKLDVQRTELLRQAHYRKGAVIIRQGEIGDRFYIIESGEVEIVQQDAEQKERRLGTRSAGDSFGEVALLQQVKRTATVRCLTPVDVLTFTRQDFRMLVGKYSLLKSHMQDNLRALAEHDPAVRSDDQGAAPGSSE